MSGPTAVATVTALSNDAGVAGDFITNIASQIVSGIYTGSLAANERIQISLDGGLNWIDATLGADNTWSVGGVTLPAGNGTIAVQTIDLSDNSTTSGTGHSFALDTTSPQLTDFSVLEPAPTNAGVIHYTVTFSEAVTGVDASQFNLVFSGVTGASIGAVTEVSGSNGTQYTIAVNTGTGSGSVKLNFVGANVHDIAGNAVAVVSQPSGVFQPQVNYPTELGASYVAIADVNEDGRPDLVITNAISNTVSILLGNGNGAFQPEVSYQVQNLPFSAVIGDLNGDGHVDLVVGNTNSGSISVLQGNGDGTFQSQSVYQLLGGTETIAMADVNGDGTLDVIAPNFFADSISVLLGNGDATFQIQPALAVGSHPSAVIVAGDLNHDGHLDLIATNFNSNSMSVLFGTGSGTFGNRVDYATQAAPAAIATGDLNGDGQLDVAVANSGSNSVSVLLGNADGTFQDQMAFAVQSSPKAIAIADLNDDGYLDVVVVNSVSGTTSVLFGNGDGTFQTQVVYNGPFYSYSVAIGDLNQDGRPDIVGTNYYDNRVSVLLNAPAGTSGPSEIIDKTAPNAPLITTTVPPVTNAASIDIAGTAEANSTVTLFNAGIQVGSTNADAAGNWHINGIALTDGADYSFTATATDVAGNTGVASSALMFHDDASAVSPPVITTTAPAQNNATTISIAGTADANTTIVTLYNNVSTFVGTANVDGTGHWHIDNIALTDGANYSFTAIASDGQSHTSSASNVLAFHDDQSAPAAPVITTTAPAQLDANFIDIAGTAEANSVVKLYNDGTQIGTTTANGSGAWSINGIILANGVDYNFTSTATDAAGNASGPSNALAFHDQQSDLIVNGDFETGTFFGWTLSGNVGNDGYGVQVRIVNAPESGQFAAGLGSVNTDGVLSQTISTTLGQTYHLSFWLWNGDLHGTGTTPNHFSVSWNGTVLVDMVNTGPQEYTQYTYDIVGVNGPSLLQFSEMEVPSEWHLDNITLTLVCFLPGTSIRTPRGEVAVEALKRGDLVTTADGRSVPVSWVGRQTISTAFADPLRVLPIRVKAGALGENLPVRDLLLSPDHALFIDGVLVHAGALVNGSSIVREYDVPEILTYYHVEVDDHSLILAENAPAETFIDHVERLAFDNWEEHEALYPDGKQICEMPFPRAKAYRQIPQTIRLKLSARAAAFSGLEISKAA